MVVEKDGLLFLTAPPSVYALNAKTGATVWRFQGGGGRGQAAAARPGLGSPAREGVAVAEGMVFVGLSDARAIALNAKTGDLVWNEYIGDNPRDKGQVVSGAPLYAAGLVVVWLERRQRLARASGRARSEDREGSLAVFRDPGSR